MATISFSLNTVGVFKANEITAALMGCALLNYEWKSAEAIIVVTIAEARDALAAVMSKFGTAPFANITIEE